MLLKSLEIKKSQTTRKSKKPSLKRTPLMAQQTTLTVKVLTQLTKLDLKTVVPMSIELLNKRMKTRVSNKRL